jgi:hypothetical protein
MGESDTRCEDSAGVKKHANRQDAERIRNNNRTAKTPRESGILINPSRGRTTKDGKTGGRTRLREIGMTAASNWK